MYSRVAGPLRFSTPMSRGRRVLGVLLVASACDRDLPPAARVSGPVDRPPRAPLVVSTVTLGVDLDPDGYLIGLWGRPRGIGSHETVTFTSLPYVGTQPIWLADVEPNCSAAEEIREIDAPLRDALHLTFTVTCRPRAAPGEDALVGVWRAESFEFFRDAALSSRLMDLIADGVVGQLTFRRAGNAEVRWEWREYYQASGADRPTLSGGLATVTGDTLHTTRVDRGAGEFECDFACIGVLHGRHVFAVSDRLVITGLERVDPGPLGSRDGAWTRLILSRIR